MSARNLIGSTEGSTFHINMLEQDPMPKPIPMTRRPPRTLEVVLEHQLDANSFMLDRTPDALREAQHHMRIAARLIDGFLGGKAA